MSNLKFEPWEPGCQVIKYYKVNYYEDVLKFGLNCKFHEDLNQAATTVNCFIDTVIAKSKKDLM